MQTGVSNTLDGSIFFDKDETIYVVVTPNDGIDNGVALASSLITVSNTPPTAPSISITPNPASQGDDLFCTVDTESEDADGDDISYTYIWSNDEGEQQSTANTEELSSVLLEAESGEWTCEITPNDGAAGPSDTASVTVENSCSSLYFDGSNDLVALSSSALLSSFSSSMTVEAWVKWSDDGSDWFPILEQGWGTNDALFFFALTGASEGCNTIQEPGRIYFEFKSSPWDSEGCIYAQDPIQNETWTHVAAVYNSGHVTLFVQGELLAEKTLSTSSLHSPTPYAPNIGYSFAGGETFFSGSIHSVHLSSSALYTQNFTPLEDIQTNSSSIGLWLLSSEDAINITDSTGNGHHGTINGANSVDSCP